VADFMVPAALGSQTAASVIRPGSFCGVVAMKPTFGRLPLEGVHPLSPSLDTLGAFTRQVADLPPILTALGRDLPEEIPPLEKPRLGLCRTELWDLAERSTRAAVEQAAAALERQGAQVREIDLGRSFLGLADAQMAIMGAEAVEALPTEISTRRADLSPRLWDFLQQGAAVSPERLREAREQAQRCRGELAGVFAGLDAVLTVAAVGEAPIGLDTTGDPMVSRIWTLLHVPSISVPVLRGPHGLPIGLQLVSEGGAAARPIEAATWVSGQPHAMRLLDVLLERLLGSLADAVHFFDALEGRAVDHARGHEDDVLEVAGKELQHREQRMDAEPRIPADEQHGRGLVVL